MTIDVVTSRRPRWWNAGLWVAQGLLAVAYLMAGGLKLSQSIDALVGMGMAYAADVPVLLIRFVGTMEVLGVGTTGYAKDVLKDVLKADVALVATVAHTESAMKFYGGMLEVATVINTSTGADLPIPTDDDTSNAGRLLGEGQAVTNTDPAVGRKVLKAYTFSSDQVLVSIQLLQDSQFDIEAWLQRVRSEIPR